MEYRINKIDTDLRQKINEERSEGKVHNKKGININKDRESTKENPKHKDFKDNGKNTDGENRTDSGFKEGQDPFRGHHIDIRR
jgi:hypothetical protein